MHLYFHPSSPYSQKVLVAMYEKDLTFEGQLVDLNDATARTDYCKQINPLGKLPMLIRPDGWVVPESSIIVEYLDTYFASGPQLIPTDRDHARQSRFYDRLGDLYLIDAAHALTLAAGDPQALATIRSKALIAVGLFEKELRNREFLVAGRFTQGDISPTLGLSHLRQAGVDLAPFANITAYLERMWARPAWQQVRRDWLAAG